jgi:outer membrane protein assembly factor BamB
VIIGAEYDERHNAFPSLTAFNTVDPSSSGDSAAAGGSLAWKALLDHTPALPNGERLKELWLKVIADNVRRMELGKAYRDSGKSAEKRAAIEAMGYKVDPKWGSVGVGMYDIAGKEAFSLETWRSGHVGKNDWCVGHMYATPVTDGKRIYSCTAFGGFFCFDLDGKLIWCRASIGQLGEYCRNGRSPILWKDPATGKLFLLSDITNKVRAFDAVTGELLWSDDAPRRRPYSTRRSPRSSPQAGQPPRRAWRRCAPRGPRLVRNLA